MAKDKRKPTVAQRLADLELEVEALRQHVMKGSTFTVYESDFGTVKVTPKPPAPPERQAYDGGCALKAGDLVTLTDKPPAPLFDDEGVFTGFAQFGDDPNIDGFKPHKGPSLWQRIKGYFRG